MLMRSLYILISSNAYPWHWSGGHIVVPSSSSHSLPCAPSTPIYFSFLTTWDRKKLEFVASLFDAVCQMGQQTFWFGPLDLGNALWTIIIHSINWPISIQQTVPLSLHHRTFSDILERRHLYQRFEQIGSRFKENPYNRLWLKDIRRHPPQWVCGKMERQGKG